MVGITNSSDYSPFGVQLDGRTISRDSYRYGYQGSEKDDEAKGAGNSYTTFYRQLDPRVGRWFSIDPKMSAWESPYVSMGNNPVFYNDPLGDTLKVKYGGFLGIGRKTATFDDNSNKWLDKSKNEIKSNNKFFKVAQQTVADLKSTETGNDLICELSSSDKVFTIRKLSGELDNGEFVSDNDEKSKKPGVGSGGTIWIAKKYSSDMERITTLGHEMGHALSSLYGTVNDKTWFTHSIHFREVTFDEQVGMYYENLIRSEHFWPLREYYSPDTNQGPASEQHPAIKP